MQQDIHITVSKQQCISFSQYAVSKPNCAQVSLGHLLQRTTHETCKWLWRW